MITFISGVILGALVAFLVSWYWVRKYGSNIENKVQETYDKIEDQVKDKFDEYFTKLKEDLKEQLAQKKTRTTKTKSQE